MPFKAVQLPWGPPLTCAGLQGSSNSLARGLRQLLLLALSLLPVLSLLCAFCARALKDKFQSNVVVVVFVVVVPLVSCACGCSCFLARLRLVYDSCQNSPSQWSPVEVCIHVCVCASTPSSFCELLLPGGWLILLSILLQLPLPAVLDSGMWCLKTFVYLVSFHVLIDFFEFVKNYKLCLSN